MSTIPVHNDVTVLLKQWQLGDKQVEQQLTQLIYEKLHQLAASCMRGERKNHTLQATALVNEAYIGLLQAEVNYQDRRHFFCLAARLMRRILVDHARARPDAPAGQLFYGDVELVVLDEADTMFDRGFGPEVRALLRVLRDGGVLRTLTVTENSWIYPAALRAADGPGQISVAVAQLSDRCGPGPFRAPAVLPA